MIKDEEFFVYVTALFAYEVIKILTTVQRIPTNVEYVKGSGPKQTVQTHPLAFELVAERVLELQETQKLLVAKIEENVAQKHESLIIDKKSLERVPADCAEFSSTQTPLISRKSKVTERQRLINRVIPKRNCSDFPFSRVGESQFFVECRKFLHSIVSFSISLTSSI